MSQKVSQGIVIIVAMLFFLSLATLTEGLAGGERADPGEFPHAVQLSYVQTRKLFCGGTIIAPNVVLTAAHCLIEVSIDIFGYYRRRMSAGSILVTAGTVSNREWTGFQVGHSMLVDRYFMHPEYDDDDLYNDIALLILEKPLIYNDKVQQVQLPPPNVIFSRGTLAGWGITDWRKVTSAYLKKIEVVLEDRDSCNSDPLMMQDGSKVSDLELCTKWKKGSSSCKGDSGSSLTCQRPAQHNQFKAPSPPSIICGLVSWGQSNAGCGESQKISVFVDVSQYLDWIQDTMEAQGFGNLTKPLPCSESEGFFDCGELGLDGEKIKSRCILIEKKCDGVNNCENGRDENETICTAKNTSESASKPEQNETTTEETAWKDPEGTPKMEGTTSEPEPGQNEKDKENTSENDLEATFTPKLDEPEKTSEEEAQAETGRTSEPEQDTKVEENTESNDPEASSTPKLEEPLEANEEGDQIETGSTSKPEQDTVLEEDTKNDNDDFEASSTPKLEPAEVIDEESQITELPGKEEQVCVWFSLFVSFTTLILICIWIAAGYWLWNRRRSRSQNLGSGEV